MKNELRLCLAQMTSTNFHAGNIEFLEKAAQHAAAENCELLAMPEAAGMMNKDKVDARKKIKDEHNDPYILACQKLARDYGIWIQTGSTPIAGGDGRFLNHANLIGSPW